MRSRPINNDIEEDLGAKTISNRRVDFSLDSNERRRNSPTFKNHEDAAMTMGQGIKSNENLVYNVTRENPYNDEGTTNINFG